MSSVEVSVPEDSGLPEPGPSEATRSPEVRGSSAGPERWAPRQGALRRLVGAELRLVLGRLRNQVLIAGLGMVPLLIGLILYFSSRADGNVDSPGFITQATQNGLFLVVAALFMCLPFLLPLTVAIASGDAIAGEASTGTLRYLLLLPVDRTRLLAAKATGALTFAAAAVTSIALVGLLTGAALFGLHDVVLLSGTTVPLTTGMLRVLGVVVYIGLSLTGLVAVGLFFSTLTEVPVAAMAATVVTAIGSTILGSLSALSPIHPYLLTYHWFDFAELLRLQIDWGLLAQGLGVQAAWIAIFGSLAWSQLVHADVTS